MTEHRSYGRSIHATLSDPVPTLSLHRFNVVCSLNIREIVTEFTYSAHVYAIVVLYLRHLTDTNDVVLTSFVEPHNLKVQKIIVSIIL